MKVDSKVVVYDYKTLIRLGTDCLLPYPDYYSLKDGFASQNDFKYYCTIIVTFVLPSYFQTTCDETRCIASIYKIDHFGYKKEIEL